MGCAFCALYIISHDEVISLAKVKKKCRICGKEYTPCSYCENDKMAFHYRTICCSRACAQVYLARVLEARKSEEAKTSNNISNLVQEVEPLQESDTVNDIKQEVVVNPIPTEKPKRKYTRKKKVKVEDSEQIDKSVGTSD